MPTASASPTKPPPALLSLTKGESLLSFFPPPVFFPPLEVSWSSPLFRAESSPASPLSLSLFHLILLPGLEVVAQVLDLEDLLGGCFFCVLKEKGKVRVFRAEVEVEKKKCKKIPPLRARTSKHLHRHLSSSFSFLLFHLLLDQTHEVLRSAGTRSGTSPGRGLLLERQRRRREGGERR